ncbi:MAG: scramblase, partial [Elusimicrobia bacterium]|nr:scramblase [Elusimicrobiota bacterium]
KNDVEVGKIIKKWSGLGKEAFTDADNFNITFPQGIDVKQKAILLGALFLIDLLYFEK